MRHVTESVNQVDSLRKLAARAPMLQLEQEKSLAQAAQAGGKRELDLLVRSHIRLVLAIAADYRHCGVSQDDLVSEGLLGLVEAAKRFDPERGVRLAGYASWWIRAYVRRYTLANRRLVRPPSTRNARKLISNLRKTQRELMQKLGRQPDSAAVAKVLGVAVWEVDEIDEALRRRDTVCGVHDVEGAARELACARPSPEAVVSAREDTRRIAQAVSRGMAALTERERRVIAQRSLCHTPSSLADLGSQLGISRERVRQIQAQGYAKMREAVLSSVA